MKIRMLLEKGFCLIVSRSTSWLDRLASVVKFRQELQNLTELGIFIRSTLLISLFQNNYYSIWWEVNSTYLALGILLLDTMGAEIFGVGDFGPETRVIIKTSTHPWYPRIFDWFWWEWSKKKDWIFFFKMAYSKKLRFSKPPILKKKNRKNFRDLSLG